VDVILMLASESVYASSPIETVVEKVGYKILDTDNDKSANGDRGDEVPRKRWTGWRLSLSLARSRSRVMSWPL